MPPWNDLDGNGNLRFNNNIEADPLTYVAEDWTTNIDRNNFRFYTTNTLNARDLESIPVTVDYVTQEQLEKFANKLYKIIEEHTHIDITEEEYLEILRGENE